MKSFNQFIKSRDKSLYREFSEMARLNTDSHLDRNKADSASRVQDSIHYALRTIDELLGDNEKDHHTNLEGLALLHTDHPEKTQWVEQHIIKNLQNDLTRFQKNFASGEDNDKLDIIRGFSLTMQNIKDPRSQYKEGEQGRMAFGRMNDSNYVRALGTLIENPLHQIEKILKDHKFQPADFEIPEM